MIALGLAHSGDSFVWAGLCALAWFLGNKQWKMRAILAFAGLVAAEIVVIGIKMCIRRPRPPGEAGRIYRKADPFSFPSGHAARAAMLCLLAVVFGPWATALGIAIWTPFMVLSRIAIGIHYVFDVVAGILLGVLLTLGVLGLAPVLTSWI
jgi:undecaprenyl-diphosphatase